MRKNQQGFGAVETIIILIVIALLAFGGWYVWKKNNDKTDKTNTNTASQQNDATPKAEKSIDPTEDWTSYSNAKGMYSFKYPTGWLIASNPHLCTEGLVLLAPSAESLGRCASEGFGQVGVFSSEGDVRNDYKFSESYYTNVQEEAVTVEGVAGNKYTTTVLGMEGEVVVGGWPDNTKVVRYIFFTNNRTYIATYAQEPSYPDALGDFNLIVTKTLKFTK